MLNINLSNFGATMTIAHLKYGCILKTSGKVTLGGVIANAGPIIIATTRPSKSTPQHKYGTSTLELKTIV